MRRWYLLLYLSPLAALFLEPAHSGLDNTTQPHGHTGVNDGGASISPNGLTTIPAGSTITIKGAFLINGGTAVSISTLTPTGWQGPVSSAPVRTASLTGTIVPAQMISTVAFTSGDNNWSQSQTFQSGATVTILGNAFSVGGSTIVVSSGLVGINVITPLDPLHIKVGIVNYNLRIRQGFNTAATEILSIGDDGTLKPLEVRGGPIILNRSGATNVSIGNSAPAVALDITGALQTSSYQSFKGSATWFGGTSNAGTGISNVQIASWTVAGTYTWPVPTAVNTLNITACGGGGGGGGGGAANNGGGGGGGGGALLNGIFQSSAAAQVLIIVGAAGTAGAGGGGGGGNTVIQISSAPITLQGGGGGAQGPAGNNGGGGGAFIYNSGASIVSGGAGGGALLGSPGTIDLPFIGGGAGTKGASAAVGGSAGLMSGASAADGSGGAAACAGFGAGGSGGNGSNGNAGQVGFVQFTYQGGI